MQQDLSPEDARFGLDTNKALAHRWVDAINRRDETPKEIAVRWHKDEFVAIVLLARTRMKKPVVMTVIRELAEGNRVVFETEGYGEMRDGFVYANAYCLLYQIDGDKIKAVRDYCCTHTAVIASEHATGGVTNDKTI
jgi:ketosteroid isomerase-like protein